MEPSKCDTDLDCPKTDRCVQYKCRLRTDGGQGTSTDAGPPAERPTQVLGGIGESCRARADCQQGFKCIAQTCQDELYGMPCGTDSQCGDNLSCVQGVCGGPHASPGMAVVPAGATAPAAPATGAAPVQSGPPSVPVGTTGVATQPPAAAHAGTTMPAPYPGADPPSSWSDFNPLDGDVHGHLGLVVAPGASHVVALGGGGGGITGFAFLLGLKGGIYYGNWEAQLELSPATWLAVLNQPTVQMNVSGAYYVPITDNLYYPLRAGMGFAAVNLPGAAFQLRGDLVGLAYKVGHIMLEGHLPSFRFATDFSNYGVMGFHFGLGATYAF